MTVKGATMDEIVRATKHSMVVIDAEKHHLDWRQSYIDNGIAELKVRYQGGTNRGASTLISRASSEDDIPKRKPLYSAKDENGKQIVKNGIVLATGEKAWRETGEAYHKPKYEKRTVRDENGDIVYKVDPKTGKKTPKKEYVYEYNERTKKYQKKIIGYSVLSCNILDNNAYCFGGLGIVSCRYTADASYCKYRHYHYRR